jgi:hypothetical protein
VSRAVTVNFLRLVSVVALFGILELRTVGKRPPRLRHLRKQWLVRGILSRPRQTDALISMLSVLFRQRHPFQSPHHVIQ